MSLSPGDIIDDKYRIIRLIGEGGMGAVYEGENTRIHRRVAIKVLHADVAGMAEVVARFEREAQAAGRIGSEHIVEVLDLGSLASGDRYMVMEFMDGDSLSQRIRARGRLSPAELYPIAHQLLDALAAAHNAGIVHRDLKPDNVFLLRNRRGDSDFVKLLDFGISKFGGSGGALSMTRTGAVMGTPYYMAPEQAKGSRELDHRVDLYAVGIVLYEALTGQVPFHADTFNELLFKIVLEEPRPIEELAPELDPGLRAIVKKGMSRDPNERFQTAPEFQAALDEWARNPSKQPASVPAKAPAAGVAQAQRVPTAGALGVTPGNWSGEAVAPAAKAKSSNTGLIAALGLAGVIVLGGAAFFLLGGKKAPATDVATAATNSAVAPAPALTTSAPAQLPAPTPVVAEPQQPSKPEVAPAADSASAAPQKAVPVPVAARVQPARPQVAPPHHAAPASPKKEPEGAQPTTGGRRIRTTL